MVTVADATLFDFETVQSLTANIRITSGSVTEDITVTITLTDVDEMDAGYTIWTGATLTFTKSSGGDPTLASQQDAITDNVKITRGNTGGQIYNIVTEAAANSSVSPAGTEWALGTVNDIANLTFEPFRAATGGKPKDVVGQNMVLHLITDDVYISIKFTSWATGKAGGFAYERSTSQLNEKIRFNYNIIRLNDEYKLGFLLKNGEQIGILQRWKQSKPTRN